MQSDVAARAFAAGAAARSGAASPNTSTTAEPSSSASAPSRAPEKPADKPADRPAAESPAGSSKPVTCRPTTPGLAPSSSTQTTQIKPDAPAPSGRSTAEGRIPGKSFGSAPAAAPPAAPAPAPPAPFVTADRPSERVPDSLTDRRGDHGGWDHGTPEDRFEAQGYASAPPAVTPTGRVAQLTVSSINLWSVLKISLMLSIAAGVALVIATSLLWMMLKGIGVFDQLNSVLGDAANKANGFNIYDYVGFGRVLSLSLLISVVNVFLLMGFSIVIALIYNLAAGLVGGIRVTLSDE